MHKYLLISAALVVSLPELAFAADAQLVADINREPGAGPQHAIHALHLTTVPDKGAFFFTLNGPAYTLWHTNGSPAPATRVGDFSAIADEQSMGTAVHKGELYFFARQQGQWALWRSNGRAENTLKVKDFSAITQMQSNGHLLYLHADDGQHGAELWRSDGTAAGTKLVRDLVTGPNGAQISFARHVDTTAPHLLFAEQAGTRTRLWQVDDASGVTTLLGEQEGFGTALLTRDKEVFLAFSAPYQLQFARFTTDGNTFQSVGPTVIPPIIDVAYTGRMLGVASCGSLPRGSECNLVRIDTHTHTALTLAKQSNTTSQSVALDIRVAAASDGLFFSLRGDDNRIGYIADTSSRTEDIQQNTSPLARKASVLGAVDNRLVFASLLDDDSHQLRITGQTLDAVTTQKSACAEGCGIARPEVSWSTVSPRWPDVFAQQDGQQLFVQAFLDKRSTDGGYTRLPLLLRSSAGAASTYPVSLGTGTVPTSSFAPRDVQRVGDKLIMSADDGLSGRELWQYHPQTGFHRLTGSQTEEQPGYPGRAVAAGSDLLFYARNTQGNWQLLRLMSGSGGGGTTLSESLFEAKPGLRGGTVTQTNIPWQGKTLISIEGRPQGMYQNGELLISDGSKNGTAKLADFSIRLHAVSGNTLHLQAADYRLYSLTGTTLTPLPDDWLGFSRSLRKMLAAGDSLYALNNEKLVVRKGNDALTTLAEQALEAVSWQNKVFFLTNDADSGLSLWQTAGSPATTTRVKSINTIKPQSGYQARLTVSHDELILSFASAGRGLEIWRSNGTEAGTSFVHAFAESEPSAAAEHCSVHLTSLFCVAKSASGQRFVWQYANGRASNVSGMLGGSIDSELQLLGERLYFAHDDGVHGSELWQVAVETNQFAPTIDALPALQMTAGNTQTVTLNIRDADSDASRLTVSARSENTSVLQDSQLQVARDGNQFRLQLSSSSTQIGTTQISINVSDGKFTATTRLGVTLTAAPKSGSSGGGGGAGAALLVLFLLVLLLPGWRRLRAQAH